MSDRERQILYDLICVESKKAKCKQRVEWFVRGWQLGEMGRYWPKCTNMQLEDDKVEVLTYSMGITVNTNVLFA